MKKLKIKLNINLVIAVLILLLPLLDIYKTVIGNKIEIFGISLVELFNFIYTFILLVLLFIKSKKENKKIFNWKFLIAFTIILFTYLIAHIINILHFNQDLIHLSNINIIIEIYHIIKSYLLPLIILFVFCKLNIDSKELLKILSFLSLFISLIIILTNIFKVSFISYGSYYEDKRTIENNIFEWGSELKNSKDINLYTSIGWFYSANQMSAILSALTFITAAFALKKNKLLYFFIFLIDCIALLMISTKTALFAIFLSIAFVFCYSLCQYIITKQNILTIKSALSFSIITIIMILLYLNSPVRYKLFKYIDNSNKNINSVELAIEDSSKNGDLLTIDYSADNIQEQLINLLKKASGYFGIPNEFINLYPVDNNKDFWFNLIQKPASEISNFRKVKFYIYKDIIKNNDNILGDKLLGIGYTSNFPELEKDVLNQNILFGYIGTLVLVIPFFIVLLYCFAKLIFNFKKYMRIEFYALFVASCYIILAALYSGHIFGSFIPTVVLSIILGTLLSSIINTSKEDLNKKKITFLLLHLGYGGIETATINTANALSEKYNVELISFYNLKDTQTSYINKNIKIKYLYNGEPNKTEFKNAVKQKNIIKIFKEGLRSANILIKKKFLIKKEILNSDSFALISTRYDFSILLSKYGRRDVIKIAQEHHHHNNNKKYINILKHKYNNIDYLFALTESLKNDYIKFLRRNNHTKIEVVPNMLSNNSCPSSNLNNKNIISVCRLDSGKRINELIDIFSKIENKDSKLYIIGDGVEKDNLKTQIKNLHLKNRIIMTGYLSKEEQEKYWLDSCLYAMTSISEGLPMVLLEAMQHSIPCIAYRTESGITDIIKNNKNGYIIDNRSSDDYIKTINSLLSNSIKLKELSIYAKEYSCNFSKDNILKLWYKVLENKG